MRRYWLVKSEPEIYSIQDLAEETDQTACWDGVRNYQARNYMRDGMRLGDGVLFYHSNAKPPGVAGTAVVAREAYADDTQFDPESDHFDPTSDPENPRWLMVDLRLEEIFPRVVPLRELRLTPGLEDMQLLRRGNRLSVMPVSRREWTGILRLGRRA